MPDDEIIQIEAEAQKELLAKKILDLDAIQESRNMRLKTRDNLKELVEAPLLTACQELYDKNIITLATSANRNDVEFQSYDGMTKANEGAYIIIDFDLLSPRNQEIGKTLGEVYFADEGQQLKIIIPLTRESTFGQVMTQAQEIANKFFKQQYRMPQHGAYTIQEMRKVYGYDPNDESIKPENFDYYYWSPQDQLLYLSQEQYQKVHEKVEE